MAIPANQVALQSCSSGVLTGVCGVLTVGLHIGWCWLLEDQELLGTGWSQSRDLAMI